MKIEQLVKRGKAYKRLLNALRNCSSETKKEVVNELDKLEGETSIQI